MPTYLLLVVILYITSQHFNGISLVLFIHLDLFQILLIFIALK